MLHKFIGGVVFAFHLLSLNEGALYVSFYHSQVCLELWFYAPSTHDLLNMGGGRKETKEKGR